MSPTVAALAIFLVPLVLFVGLGSVAASLVVSSFGRKLLRLAPSVRHRYLLALMALPLVFAAVLMLSVTLPSMVSLGLPSVDHCALHDDGHPHLCFTHLPTSTSPFIVAALALVTLALAWQAGGGARRLLGGLSLVEVLEGTGERWNDVTVLESDAPLCVTAGLVKPRIFVSRGLLGRLSAPGLEVVLSHEREHVHRRDTLWGAVARALCVFHFPPTARWLSDQRSLAAEQACDDAAARSVGDALLVAETLLVVERLATTTGDLGSVAIPFGEGALEARVRALVDRADYAHPPRVRLPLALATVAIFAAAPWLHHLTESLLSLFAS